MISRKRARYDQLSLDPAETYARPQLQPQTEFLQHERDKVDLKGKMPERL